MVFKKKVVKKPEPKIEEVKLEESKVEEIKKEPEYIIAKDDMGRAYLKRLN